MDIDPQTALMDLKALKKKLESVPKNTYQGIIPVDFAGYPLQMDAFKEIADEFGLWVIEDACHAPGGYYSDSNGQQQFCGNGIYADLAIFSFHPVKHIACGEGGMITTNNPELYESLMMLRTHGITKDPSRLQENHGGWYYEMQDLGYNYRLTDFQAALGISQLNRANENLRIRRELAKVYDNAFEGSAVKPLKSPLDGGHAYHLYVIQVNNRKEVYDQLRAHNIYAQVHYIPVHYQPYYQDLGFKKGDFPCAEEYYNQCLSLPLYPTLEKEEQQYVIDVIINVASN